MCVGAGGAGIPKIGADGGVVEGAEVVDKAVRQNARHVVAVEARQNLLIKIARLRKEAAREEGREVG